MWDRDYRLQKLPYSIVEDEFGQVVQTDYFDSEDEKAGRELYHWSSKWRRVRAFISKRNQFDTINIIGTPHRCLIGLGYAAHTQPPGAWTEFVCENGEPSWTGYLLAPEHNWMGSLVPDELAAAEFTVEFYAHVSNLNPKTGELRRGRGQKAYVVRKLWQCPGRFAVRMQVPYLVAFPGFPKLPLAEFDRHWESAAPATRPSAPATTQPL